jgi:hypothetical protein
MWNESNYQSLAEALGYKAPMKKDLQIYPHLVSLI